MARSHVRTWCMRCSAFALSLIVALFTLEVTIRIVSDEGTTLLVKDSAVGQRYQADFEGSRFIPEAGRTIALRFNKDGFRGPNRPYTKAPNVRRLAVLGDSFIAGVAVEESGTFTAQLQDMLNASATDGTQWEVLNFGVSGSGTGQQRLIYQEVARKYHPDLVLLCFFVGNDFADNSPSMGAANRPVYVLDERDSLKLRQPSSERTSFSRWLAETSHLYVWQKNKIRMLRDQVRESFGIVSPGAKIFCSAPDERGIKVWSITEKIIHALADDVAADHASFAIALLPAHEQVLTQRWNKLIDCLPKDQVANYRQSYPDERLATICKAKRIPLYRLASDFRQASCTEELFFRSEGHWTEAGNRVAAHTISQRLTRLIAQLPNRTFQPHTAN